MGGVDDPFEWKEIKDRICRRYPRMGHPTWVRAGLFVSRAASATPDVTASSLWLKSLMTMASVIWGHVPDEAKGMLNGLFFNPL
jgi:hypothetical protein